MDRFKLLGAAGFLLLAAPSWAGPDRTEPPQAQLDALEHNASNPEDFRNYVDGSVTRQGTPAEPAVRAAAAPAGQAPAVAPSRSEPRRQSLVVPPAPRAGGLSRAASEEEPVGLLLPGLAVGTLLVFGLLFMDDGRRPIWTAPAVSEIPQVPAERISLRPAPPLAVSEVPQVPLEPFIDTRMPCPTWRAISLSEQRLIDAWDRSRERALGLASLDEWLDSRADTAGVDIPRLKAKLRREV